MNQDRLFSWLVFTIFLLLLMALLNHLLTPVLVLLALTALNSVDQLLDRVRLFIQFWFSAMGPYVPNSKHYFGRRVSDWTWLSTRWLESPIIGLHFGFTHAHQRHRTYRQVVRRYSQMDIQMVRWVFGVVGRLPYFRRVLLGTCLEVVSNGAVRELLTLEDDRGKHLARMA